MRFRTGTPYEALGCLPSLQHNTPFCSEISSEIKLVFNHSLVSNHVAGFPPANSASSPHSDHVCGVIYMRQFLSPQDRAFPHSHQAAAVPDYLT